MAKDTQRKAFLERVEDFLQNRKFDYWSQMDRIADNYPEERSVIINYWDLAQFDSSMASFFLEHPNEALSLARDVMRGLLPPDVTGTSGPKLKLNFRIERLPPETHRILIRDLRSTHLDKLLAIDGLVRNVTEVRPRLISAMFKCPKCGNLMQVPQLDSILKEPFFCDNEECGKTAAQARFELMVDLSEFIDTQTITIQENPEGLAGGSAPQRLRVYANDDLCGIINPGDRIIMNGVLSSMPKKAGSSVKYTDYDIVLMANSVERTEHAYEEISISEEERIQIEMAARDKNIMAHVRDSIAPAVYHMDKEKEAIALQLFGGVTKGKQGSRHRGDIHILLIGDPGTAKSQILRFVSDLAPRGIFASGKASTAAGLTATAVKDEHDGRWTLEGGALVLADMGLVCIDEIDKMREEDRSSMHEAMEQQSLSIAKAGINATLQTRCSILAAANPAKGRFTEDKSVPEQINLSTTLLSRFDIIFPMYDIPDKAKDDDLAEMILRGQRAEEIRKNIEGANDSPYSAEDVNRAKNLDPYFDRDFLHKYIAHAKRSIFPVMDTDVLKKIREYYVSERAAGVIDEGAIRRVSMTARQLEALIRLSEASARMRLSTNVEMHDCKIAIGIFEYFMNKVARDRTGKWDSDFINVGTSASERNLVSTIRGIITEISREQDKDSKGKSGVNISEIYMKATQEMKLTEADVKKSLDNMNRNGEIYFPTHEKVNLTQR